MKKKDRPWGSPQPLGPTSPPGHRWVPRLLLLVLLPSLTTANPDESCLALVPPSPSASPHSSSSSGSSHFHHHNHYQSAALQSSSSLNSANSNNPSYYDNNNNNNNNWGETVLCQIRTLHPELDFDNLTTTSSVPSIGGSGGGLGGGLGGGSGGGLGGGGSGGASPLIDWSLVIKLTLQCNDVLFFESSLSNPDQLGLFQNLQDLSIDKCKLKYLGSGTFRRLKHLKRLRINTENSDWASRSLELSPRVLDDVIGLRELNLGLNHMWNLPDALLCEVPSLQSLNLTHNLLSDLDDLGLPPMKNWKSSVVTSLNSPATTCLSELRALDLSHNNLRRVDPSKLERLKRLQELHLHHNWLEELHDDSFLGLSQLKNLNLSSNRLVALPPKLFQYSKLLRDLDLHNNSLTTLSSELLQPLEYLQVLDFSSNSLTTTEGEPFRGNLRLVILNLSRNQISTLNPSTFKELYTLQVLDLSQNQISNIDPDTFMSMSNLHSLNLGRNRLRVISAHHFDGLYVLHKLILDYNQITTMDVDSLKNCTSLQDLGLVGNLLTNIPPALKGLQLLRTLDLGENRISVLLNTSFQGLGQLYGLRLVDNQIQVLPRNLCESLGRLRVFNVAQNQINKISSGAFQSCPDLRVLRLDSNKLQTLPATLTGQLPNLLWLNLSSNHLARLEYSGLPQTLEWLDVSYNQLEFIGMGRGGVRTHLRVIDASQNLLKVIDQSAIPPSLEILRLNHNRLEKILPDTFIRAGNLRRAELVGNQMENLPLASLRLAKFPENKPLPEFFLGGNPFLCDCEMEWLTRVSQLSTSSSRSHPLVMDMDGIVCRLAYSRAATHLPMSEMKPHDFLCPYRSHCFALCHCCEFDACDCAMTCPGNCTCYHDDTWTGNVIDCARTGQLQIPARLPMDSTEVYLDGNEIPVLKSHTLIGRKNLKNLYLNASRIELISNKSFNGLQSLESLHLEHNLLVSLQGFEFENLGRLRELYLHQNRIRSISNATFLTLKSLEILRLDGNQLMRFQVWQLSLNPYLVEIGLSRNPWDCDCEFLIQFHSWVQDNVKKVEDIKGLQCTWNGTRSPGPSIQNFDNGTCGLQGGGGRSWTTLIQSGLSLSANGGVLPWIILLLGITSLLVMVGLLLWLFCRERFSFWVYSQWGFRPCGGGRFRGKKEGAGGAGGSGRGGPEEDEKAYDAYLIYSQKDEEWVNEKLGEELEAHDNYRLCLHHRDLINDGGDLRSMMWGVLDNAHSLVVVVSRNFYQEWGSSSLELGVVNSVIARASTGIRNNRKKSRKSPSKPVLIIQTDESQASDYLALSKGSQTKVLKWGEEETFWKRFKFHLPEPCSSSAYSSNITTNTTTTSVMGLDPKGRVGGGGGNCMVGGAILLTTNGEEGDGKLWSYTPGGFVALQPPKYQLTQLPKSPPSNSTDSTAVDHNSDGSGSSGNSGCSSYYSHHPALTMMIQTPPPHLPKSPLPNVKLYNGNSTGSNSGSNTLNSGGFAHNGHIYHPPRGGDSYLSVEGEHVYSSLDPPSPLGGGGYHVGFMSSPQVPPPPPSNSPNVKNIHLPNGYTYSPSPRPQPEWHPHPSRTSNPPGHHGGGGGSNTKGRKANNGGGSNNATSKSGGDSVQTYLV